MKKVAVIGLDNKKNKLISDLMELGVLEITDQSDRLLEENFSGNVSKDGNEEEVAEMESRLNKIALAITTLEHYSLEKAPLFVTRKSVKREDFEVVLENKLKIEKDIEYVLSLHDKLQKTREKINKATSELFTVSPWISYSLSLNETNTEYTKMHLGVVPSSLEIEPIIADIEEKTPNSLIQQINKDKDLIYLGVLTTNESEEKTFSILKQFGFTVITFKHTDGTPAETITMLKKTISDGEKECIEIEAEISKLSDLAYGIKCVHDNLIIEKDKELIKEKILKTKRTFYLEGWLPVIAEDSVINTLDQNGCYYVIREPEEGEEVPVLTVNNSMVTPFESITDMYSLPDYKGIDPTKYFSFFYAMFFGIMLSDAGYGMVITITCFIILKKFDLEGMTYKMIKMFFFCGISTIFWGAMFGGWFGDFATVAAKTIFNKDFVIQPIWFNPLADPTKLLIFSLLFGVAHIFFGMGIKAYMLIRRGQWVDAICDVGAWYLVIIGLGLLIAGGSISESVVPIGKYMAAAGGAILLFTGGRKKKGIGRIFGGLGSIYSITGYISDILSYSRLLALGLATGVIAQVVNTMGSLAGGGVFGTIVLLVVFVFGHAFNMTINSLGAFVHSSRLQYIEFFGKFYEDGGEPFNPLKKETKYVKLINNANGGMKKW